MTSQNRKRNNVEKPIPVNIRNVFKSMAKQNNKASVLIRGPNDPVQIKRDILVQKVVEFTTTTANVSFTNAAIYNLLDPGSTPFFTHMRVIKVAVFGPPSTTAVPSVSLSINYDGAFFLDKGIGTARTPNLHVRLPEFIRESWYSTTDSTAVCAVAVSGTVCQFTIEVRADTSSDT